MATNKDVTPPSTWKVIGVNPSVDIAGGTPVKGNTITFLTGLGHRGQVFAPESTPVPDGVAAIVREAAYRLDTIGTLSE